MGLMDKVKFWDNDDDFDLDEELPPIEEDHGGFDEETGRYRDDEFSTDKTGLSHNRERQRNYPQPQGFQQQGLQQGTTGNIQKDLDLISSKLDAIKSELDSMDQRIRKIEKIAEGEQANDRRKSRDPWANYE